MQIKNSIFIFLIVLLSTQSISQESTLNDHDQMQCGSDEILRQMMDNIPGYEDSLHQHMRELQQILKSQTHAKSLKDVYTLPVVFHVVYNNETENIHDSVIYNQLDVLNKAFRRQNEDTVNMRPIFNQIVGDAGIQFVLAKVDPDGNPTNGITRTYTNIKNFYPEAEYVAGQGSVTDKSQVSRIMDDQQGGKSPWNTNKYINIWVGDLSQYRSTSSGYVDEDALYGVASFPKHQSIHFDSTNGFKLKEDGIIMHYKTIGSNNNIPYTNNYYPTGFLDNKRKGGKMLVHEMGHYLGLFHIWGATISNCEEGDYIHDTPGASLGSLADCNIMYNQNNCIDTILGQDLPDMIENYMDYSPDVCMNSFTHGQIDIMRLTINIYRPSLLNYAAANIDSFNEQGKVAVYPNPTRGNYTLSFEQFQKELTVIVYGIDGKVISQHDYANTNSITAELTGEKGIYIIHVHLSDGSVVKRSLVKEA